MKKLFLTAFLCFFPLASMAAPLTYVLHDVVFDDGGTAVGSFDWSMETGPSNVFITSTAGQSRGYDVTYTDLVFPGVLGVNFGFSLVGSHPGTTDYWSISFDFTGPFAGAFYLSAPHPEFFDAYAERGSANTYLRNIASGYVAPVPVPGAAWLFGSALVGLFFRRRR